MPRVDSYCHTYAYYQDEHLFEVIVMEEKNNTTFIALDRSGVIHYDPKLMTTEGSRRRLYRYDMVLKITTDGSLLDFEIIKCRGGKNMVIVNPDSEGVGNAEG